MGGEGGESWKEKPSMPDGDAVMETSFGVPFMYLVGQIFFFTLSRSICITQLSGKYCMYERGKKDQNSHPWPGMVI